MRFTKNYNVFENHQQILTHAGEATHGNERSDNSLAAKSIKVGRDIMIKRDSKNFIVRTANGEAILPNTLTSDMGYIWVALGHLYDNGPRDMKHVAGNLTRQLRDTDLRVIARHAAMHDTIVPNKKNKYEAAIEQLKEMGIQPKRLFAYMQKQQKEND